MFKYLLSGLLLLFSSTVFGYECSKEMDELSSEYSIKIICKSYSYYPSHVKENTPPVYLVNRYVRFLKTFFSLYNTDFLRNNIQEIRLSSPLLYNGKPVGGVSNGEKLLMNVDVYDDEFHLIALNHEFSSNILKSLSERQINSWSKFSPYYDTSRSYLMKCITEGNFFLENTEYNYSRGFLTNYSLTNYENDFNIYAQKIFANEQDLKHYSKKYEIIQKKVDFVKNAYRQLGFKGKFPDET